MLVADAVDADGGQQHQVFLDVDAVDLDRQQVQGGQVGGHPFLHAFRRQRHEPPRHRRLRHSRPGGRRDVAARQADGAAELAGRDVDQHQVQRPLAEQVFRLRRLPARQRQLAAVASTNARTIDLDLAAVEADLPLGLAPAIPVSPSSPAVARAAQLGRLLIHHRRQSRQARRQAETIEAGSDFLPSLIDDCRRHHAGRSGSFLHGVALLRGFDTPSLMAQGGQRLLPYFNIDRDIPQNPSVPE